MMTAPRYCRLVRLDSSGGFQVQTLPQVQAWFLHQCADLLIDTPMPDPRIQRRLLSLWRLGGPEGGVAELSLRCFVSHSILQVCTQLANQFGTFYRFSREDVLPLVLDDVGDAHRTYQPFTVQILNSYDEAKAQLSAWAAQLTRNHNELNRYLVGKGLYRTSDWAILNDTTAEQLQRILAEYHRCRPAEVEAAQALLHQYHRVYRQERLQPSQRRRGRCQPPTAAQLQRMLPGVPAAEGSARLKGLAAQLRQYRIHVRGGHPTTFLAADLGDDFNLEHLPDPVQGWGDEEIDQVEFLQVYRGCLQGALKQALVQTIQARLTCLQQRDPTKGWAYLQGLWLFYGKGLSMGEIAPHLGLKSQVQVTRLLQLGQLRQAVGGQLVAELQHQVWPHVLRYTSTDRLAQIADQLDQLLAAEVEGLMAAAVAEIQASKGRTTTSLFAVQIRQALRQLMESGRPPGRQPAFSPPLPGGLPEHCDREYLEAAAAV